jgi:hypothetical protein
MNADLGHALVAFDGMASMIGHYRTDVVLFWNTQWRTIRTGSRQGTVTDALYVSAPSFVQQRFHDMQ